MRGDVGDYRIEELLGYGGCGEVWRARHRDTGESVALKWLRGGDPEQRVRQRREAGLLAAVSHPHLGALREVLSDRGDAVLVLDYHAGGSLSALLGRRRRLRPGEVVSVLAPVAAALAYAHDEGLVHGDVTPGNVLFGASGRPVLTDLGVARVLGDELEVHATPEYVDPLVARGAAPTAASDVFGLGAVAFHALTGIPPWNAAGPEATLAVAADGVLPDLRQLAADAPADLLAAILRALSIEPAERGSAADFALDVRHSCPPEPVALEVDARGRPRPPARTGPVTQGLRPARSGGRAHAAEPPRRGPARCPDALARLSRVVVARWRGGLAGLVVAAAVALAVLVGLRWDGADPPPPGQAGPPAPAAAAEPEVNPEYAVPATPDDWTEVVNLLYDRRAEAFATADAEPLADVYTRGSAQAVADRTEITELAGAGYRTAGFGPEVVDVVSAQWRSPTVTLVVRDRFGPYTVVDEQGGSRDVVVAAYAGRDLAQVRIQLRLTDDGWRIESALLLAGAG